MPDDTQTPAPSTCIPPKKFERNEYGLICDGSVQYVYNDDGSINWRKMIKPEYLVPNSDNFQERGLPVPTSTEGLPDKDVLILLAGLKELAAVRGFSSVTFSSHAPNENYALTNCYITWIPNYETYGKEVTFSAVGDASHANTSKLGGKYLGPISENRAFCRTIRNFLKIHIVSKDEVGLPAETEVEDVSTSLLRETLKKHNFPFEKVKEKLVEEGVEGAASWNRIEDMPRFRQLEVLERIKRKVGEA